MRSARLDPKSTSPSQRSGGAVMDRGLLELALRSLGELPWPQRGEMSSCVAGLDQANIHELPSDVLELRPGSRRGDPWAISRPSSGAYDGCLEGRTAERHSVVCSAWGWIFEPGQTEASFAPANDGTWVSGCSRTSRRDGLDPTRRSPPHSAAKDATGSGPARRSRRESALCGLLRRREPPKVSFVGRFVERTGDTSFRPSPTSLSAGPRRRSRSTCLPRAMENALGEGEEIAATLTRTGFQAPRALPATLRRLLQERSPAAVVVEHEIAVQLNVEAIMVAAWRRRARSATTGRRPRPPPVL